MPFKKKLKEFKKSIIVSLGIVIAVSSFAFLFIDDSVNEANKIKQFNGIYEPSAAQQLTNGTLIILEDEISRALNSVDVDSFGNLIENAIGDKQLNSQLKQSFDDLEGVALSHKGEIYATTSFSRTSKGKRRPNREKLLRLVFDDDGSLIKQDVYPDFIDSLKDAKLFKRLNAKNDRKNVKLKDINIEGLSFDEDKQHLLFGLKAPLINDLSVIIRLENPQQVLDGDDVPVLSKKISLLDLNGGGIRSLAYDDTLRGYLIANEVDFGGGSKQSQLWFWDGKQQPIALIIPDIVEMKNIEAITAVSVAGKLQVLVMSDDGSRRNKQPAHYQLIDYIEIHSQIIP